MGSQATAANNNNNKNKNKNNNININNNNQKDIQKTSSSDRDRLIEPIISYLNEKTGKAFRAGSEKTRACIRARAAEGFTEEDFRTVIDIKAREWGGTEMAKYLRPETLFGTKFEGYLNSNPTGGNHHGNESDAARKNIGVCL